MGFCQAKLDVLSGEDDGFKARGAHFVDCDGFDGGGEASEDGGLTGGCLAYGGLEDVAHVYVGDFGDWDFGFLEGGFYCHSTELGRGDGGEGAIELEN